MTISKMRSEIARQMRVMAPLPFYMCTNGGGKKEEGSIKII